jgi:4'-phosphopantetheinyl transferase
MIPSLQLVEKKVDVWICESENVHDKFNYFLSLLSAQELSRANRFKFEVHKQNFVNSHGFKRSVLAKYLNLNPASIVYNKGIKGKPYLADKNSLNLSFNLSHTEDISLLAVTKNLDVGIDIECVDRKTDWKSICKRFFTEYEQQALFSLQEQQQQQAFYELWTRKEAYIKLLGTGLSLSPTQFTLTVPPQPPALIEHESTKYKAPELVNFKEVKLPESLNSYRATLAANFFISEYSFYQYK